MKKEILEKHLQLLGYKVPEVTFDRKRGWLFRFKTKDNRWTAWQNLANSFDYALRDIWTCATIKEWVKYSK